MLDDVLVALGSFLLGGGRWTRWGAGAARQRLENYRDGLRVFVPVDLTITTDDSPTARTKHRRFEIRVMAGHPRETAFGWWDVTQLGEPAAALLSTTGHDDGDGAHVRIGDSPTGASFHLRLQPEDWQILAHALE